MTHARTHPCAVLPLLVALTVLAACGDDADGGVDGPAGVDSTIANDLGAIGDDSGAKDAGTTSVDSDEPVDSGGEDIATADSGPDCPGDPGCVCTSNNDCDNGHCIDVGTAKQCARKCVDSCPSGFSCVAISAGGGDSVTICVPSFDRLCEPCAKSAACQTLGFTNNACVDRGANGAFCGVSCADDAGCPTDYACQAVKSIEGTAVKQCVAVDDKGQAAACSCSERAKSLKLTTVCSIQKKNAKGEVVSSCEGTRSCDATGLTACIGPDPTGEKCNGIDDDCDGKTDEDTCDDNNACTADGCNAAAGGKVGCIHNAIDGPCDADGSACTVKDACKVGVCTPGKAKNCDDGNGCTVDACDPANGCTVTNADGGACDDGNPCTLGDACKAGACQTGGAKACPDGGPCVLAKCDLATGKCAYKNTAAPCDDASPCTAKDACDGGFCTGKAVSCDDANPCTDDSCDGGKKGKPGKGCVHADNAAPCTDNNLCTDKDGCKGGACVGIAKTATQCDDNNPCTTDGCAKKTGCTHDGKAGAGCDDGNICTSDDACAVTAGKATCEGGTYTCACKTTADCKAKEDGDACNGTLVCDQSGAKPVCKIDKTTVVTCAASSDVCQVNRCGKTTGKCGLIAVADGKPCDADGSVCTSNDACVAGSCKAGPTAKCDDVNPCTNDACDAKKGCQHTANTASCNADDNACTVADGCSNKVCIAGKKKTCDDGNACTADACDTKTGKCGYNAGAKNGTPCDDGSVCTLGDTCAAGFCKAGKKRACEDGNPCTDNPCHAKKGCQTVANTSPCDDANPCTVKDACVLGKCKSGNNVCGCQQDADCKAKEDGNPCNGTLHCAKQQLPYQCKVDLKTVVICDAKKADACHTNTCQPKTGTCALVAANKDKSCDDGDACSVGDVCGANKSGWGGVAGAPKKCDDGNVCTADSCDAKKGCLTNAKVGHTVPCYGGPKNTVGKGTCVSGKRACDKAAKLGPCIGQVTPVKPEKCDGKDDDCDGITDGGCKVAGATLCVTVGHVNTGVGKGSIGVDGNVGDVAIGQQTGGKVAIELGWYGWLRAWTK